MTDTRSPGAGARWRIVSLAAIAVFLAAAAWAYVADRGQELGPRPENERPVLLLVTSLPIVFGEELSLEGGGSDALRALETRYRVVPIGVTDADSLKQGRLLLMAHPLAQPAESLVELDRWVRGGGGLLLLADPALDWPSERPLGDMLRPPPGFADTGLLAHWGLRLYSPETNGSAAREIAGKRIATSSPGSLSGGCDITTDGLVARCRIGNGRATIIADADLLNVEGLADDGDNLDALLGELARLESRRFSS